MEAFKIVFADFIYSVICCTTFRKIFDASKKIAFFEYATPSVVDLNMAQIVRFLFFEPTCKHQNDFGLKRKSSLKGKKIYS